MANENSAPLLGTSLHAKGYNLKKGFTSLTTAVLVVLLALFCAYVHFDKGGNDGVQGGYLWYIHTAIMIWVGFGFLMCFLRKYCLAAVSLNFLTSCVVTLEAILIVGALISLDQKNPEGKKLSIQLNVDLFIEGLFAAGAGMITFGALLGKVSPAQLMLLLVLEVPMYAINTHVLVGNVFGARDTGGSLGIHAFGAYFGLAASWFLSKKGTGAEHTNNGSSRMNDVISMIGTIYLWILWPSFNAAAAAESDKFVSIANTVLSLLGSCVSTFIVSAAVDGKFDMVHIQNATLAGGVAMGSSADLISSPGAAILVGVLAGIISVLGFRFLSPALEKHTGLKDTCGIHNLHGMPGLLGGLVALVQLAVGTSASGFGESTPVFQLFAILVTLGFSLIGGAVSGVLVSFLEDLDAEDAIDFAFDDTTLIASE